MANLKLQDTYLNYKEDLLVKEMAPGIVALYVVGYNIQKNHYRPALSTMDITAIIGEILNDNKHYALKSVSGTLDGGILHFVQVIPESAVINIDE